MEIRITNLWMWTLYKMFMELRKNSPTAVGQYYLIYSGITHAIGFMNSTTTAHFIIY